MGMRNPSLMAILLVAAALAGCTGGTSNEGQLPTDLPTGTGSPGSPGSNSSAPAPRSTNATFDAYLEVSADNGTAPLNVTLSFGASASPEGEQHNLTWTLVVHANATADAGNGTAGDSTGNATGNSTGNATGNSTGNGTGNGTGNSTSTGSSSQTSTGSGSGNSTSTSTASPSNSTGNQTGNGAGSGGSGSGNGTGNQTGGPTGNQTGNATGNGTDDRAVVASFNGTGDELPGNRSVVLNATGEFEVTFTVRSGDETVVVRSQTIAVQSLPPGSPLGNETRTFEGSFLASEPLLLCMGSDEHEWSLNGTFAGTPADVSHVNVTIDASGLDDAELILVAPNGTEVAKGPEINQEGPFEVGTYVLRVESCLAADVDYTVTAIANYATPGGFE